jgi:hypothetical protein
MHGGVGDVRGAAKDMAVAFRTPAVFSAHHSLGTLEKCWFN